MAKRGLALYFMLSVGWIIVGGLFYFHFKYSMPFEDPEKFYLKAENKSVILSESQMRFMSERKVSKDIPISDTKNGYM